MGRAAVLSAQAEGASRASAGRARPSARCGSIDWFSAWRPPSYAGPQAQPGAEPLIAKLANPGTCVSHFTHSRRFFCRDAERPRSVPPPAWPKLTALEEVLEAEMTEALGAEKGERTVGRLGYRSGYYGRTLITRIGKLELRVPQDRAGRFSTELFERYQRSERALVAALAEMYVQGVSTRKVKAITEELCGHSFSASSISAINQRLDASLAQFAGRPLVEAFPYLILDARYERVRETGVIVSQAVLIAIGIDWDGRRQVLAVELANRESRSSWRDFLLGLKARGLHGVEFVVADDHAGLRAALREVLAEAAYQRCCVHFL